MWLTVNNVLVKGLKAVGFSPGRIARVSNATNNGRFRAHYGSSPLDVAEMWYDLCHTDIPESKLPMKDKNERGFKRFLVSLFWLFTKPKNQELMASRFGLCEREVGGDALWKWIKRIQGMKKNKIVWPEQEMNDPAGVKIIFSVDGVDFKIWELKNPRFNRDPAWCSNKFKAAGVRYEIALSIHSSKIIWLNGPFKCGSNPDRNIFRANLIHNIPRGKKGVADRGYEGCELQLCLPTAKAPKRLQNFMSRVRCRQETFNSRLKNFSSMSETWTHGIEKHQIAFEVVCVIVQYQMDNGSALFDP